MTVTPAARRRTVLSLAAEGYGDKEIAARLSLDEKAVKRDLERERVRYGARNTKHLVAMVSSGARPRRRARPVPAETLWGLE